MLGTALLLAFAAPVLAQTTYAAPGDTLRFREVTRAELRLTTPQGEIPMTTEHDATIAVVRLPGDSARAWYEALVLGMSSPMGSMRPATDPALHRPFTLTFDARGRVGLLEAPPFPASFEGLTDLAHQFDDFFLRLPAQPLRAGLTWSDTTVRTDSTADKSMRRETIAAYRVERDTVVGGQPALVIGMTQQLRSRAEGPVPNQPMRAETRLEGSEEGYVVFAPAAGRLVGRRRSGSLAGDVVMRGAGGEMSLKQSFTYTSSIDAIP